MAQEAVGDSKFRLDIDDRASEVEPCGERDETMAA